MHVLELLAPAGCGVRVLDLLVHCAGEGSWRYPLGGCRHDLAVAEHPLCGDPAGPLLR